MGGHPPSSIARMFNYQRPGSPKHFLLSSDVTICAQVLSWKAIIYVYIHISLSILVCQLLLLQHVAASTCTGCGSSGASGMSLTGVNNTRFYHLETCHKSSTYTCTHLQTCHYSGTKAYSTTSCTVIWEWRGSLSTGCTSGLAIT